MSGDYDVFLTAFPDAIFQNDPRSPAERLAMAMGVEPLEAALLVLSVPCRLRAFRSRRGAHDFAVQLTQLGAEVEVKNSNPLGLARSREGGVPSTDTHMRARLVAAEIAVRRGRIYHDFGE
jgi:hypothetical protein